VGKLERSRTPSLKEELSGSQRVVEIGYLRQIHCDAMTSAHFPSAGEALGESRSKNSPAWERAFLAAFCHMARARYRVLEYLA